MRGERFRRPKPSDHERCTRKSIANGARTRGALRVQSESSSSIIVRSIGAGVVLVESAFTVQLSKL